jgi:hypothetical protein
MRKLALSAIVTSVAISVWTVTAARSSQKIFDRSVVRPSVVRSRTRCRRTTVPVTVPTVVTAPRFVTASRRRIIRITAAVRTRSHASQVLFVGAAGRCSHGAAGRVPGHGWRSTAAHVRGSAHRPVASTRHFRPAVVIFLGVSAFSRPIWTGSRRSELHTGERFGSRNGPAAFLFRLCALTPGSFFGLTQNGSHVDVVVCGEEPAKLLGDSWKNN